MAPCARATEWSVDLPTPGEHAFALPLTALNDVAALSVHLGRWPAPRTRIAWLELTIVCADDRRFVTADAVPIEEGDTVVPLDGGAWSGHDAPLGGDALSAVRALVVRAYGGDGATIAVRVAPLAADRGTPRFAAQLLGDGLVERGPWRELRLRLAGDVRAERGEVDLVADDGRRVPCFLEQPGVVELGAWRPHGPCRWVARLRPDEDVTGWRIAWRDGGVAWRGEPLPRLAVALREAAPVAPPGTFAFPISPAWSGSPATLAGPGRFARAPRADFAACPAPILAWQAGWTGFRGPATCAHPQAAALDALAAAGVAELDLLPQTLFDEHDAFRFGLAPWHADQGGPWRAPQDALVADAPLAQWRAHARWIVARCRAAPGLARWRAGMTQAANAPAELARLRTLLGDLAALVAACDGRPLVAFHLQAIDFGYLDPKAAWYDFESGTQGWRSGLTPLAALRPVDADKPGSEGERSLPIALDLAVGATRAGGAWVPVDASLFNLDRLELDARLDGGGAATVYAWCTDSRHRWYQQRLGDVSANGRWQTLGIDFADGAAWEPSGHATPWDGTQRRRVRLLGLMAFGYDTAGAPAAGARALRIDRVRRLGWPAMVTDAPLALIEPALPATTEVARWRPLVEDFALNIACANPFDPDSADVVAEVEGPDGLRLRHPAYWSEPMRLDLVDGVERAVPIGAGGWHWKFMPPRAGAWRWRILARVKWRDRWLETAGAWHAATVRDAGDGGLAPIRRALNDAKWFETADGAFWYPIGLNLRSPGDSRQDRVVAQARAAVGAGDGPTLSVDWEKLGTRAYERWLPKLAQNGGNFARVWMCPWWCGLEWRRDWDGFNGVGWYDQAGAARLDRVLELAAAKGVRVQLELQNHGMFSRRVDAQWDDNPYNRRRGGTCDGPADFFTREDAWTGEANRLRYIVARWGGDPTVAMWVLSSEIEFTGGWERDNGLSDDAPRSPTLEAWLKRAATWLRANDALARPVSVHFSHPWTGLDVWTNAGMEWSYSNAYTGFQDEMRRLGGPGSGLDGCLSFYLERHFPPWQTGRPALIGEWGGHWDTNTHPRLVGEWHTGLWIQAVLPYAGNTGFWWWLWVDVADRWAEFAGPARFAKGFDPRGVDWRPSRPRVGDARLSIVGMASPDEQRYYAFARGSDRDPGIRFRGDAGAMTLTVGTPGAAWQVERWDCERGEPVATTTLTANGDGLLEVPLGAIDLDAAWIVRRAR